MTSGDMAGRQQMAFQTSTPGTPSPNGCADVFSLISGPGFKSEDEVIVVASS